MIIIMIIFPFWWLSCNKHFISVNGLVSRNEMLIYVSL